MLQSLEIALADCTRVEMLFGGFIWGLMFRFGLEILVLGVNYFCKHSLVCVLAEKLADCADSKDSKHRDK